MIDVRAVFLRERNSFLRFSLVGGFGFLADSMVLMLLVYKLGIGPLAARLISFPVAVALTFLLNATWSFGKPISGVFGWRSIVSYLSVQGSGFVCNAVVYTSALLLLRPPLNAPFLALALAAAVALAVNYFGSRRFVFGA